MNKSFMTLFLIVFLVSCGGSSSSGGDSHEKESQVNQASPEVMTPVEGPVQDERDPMKEVILRSPGGEAIKTSLAYTSADQQQGLSGVQPEDFDDDMGKLFMYKVTASRVFWMPNTYFDLDVIYLDTNLKILRIVRDLPFYTGTVNSEISRAPAVTSRHVLEMKSGSPIADSLDVGDQLRWESSLSLRETLSEI